MRLSFGDHDVRVASGVAAAIVRTAFRYMSLAIVDAHHVTTGCPVVSAVSAKVIR